MFTDQPASDDGEIVQLSPDRSGALQPEFQVRVCQNTACTKQGALAVWQAFKDRDLAHVEVVATGCLGCCGNGPMVLVLPDETWYSHVQVQDVEAIATQHFATGQPVTRLLDRSKYPARPPSQPENVYPARSLRWLYGLVALAVLLAIASIVWAVWGMV